MRRPTLLLLSAHRLCLPHLSSYQLQLGQFDKALGTVHELFERGSTEDHSVHGAYMCALLECDKETCLEVVKLKGTGTLATFRPLSDEERGIFLRPMGILAMRRPMQPQTGTLAAAREKKDWPSLILSPRR
jgi:hypothetical protein